MPVTELFPIAPRVGLLGEGLSHDVPTSTALCRQCGFAFSSDRQLVHQYRLGQINDAPHVSERGHPFVNKTARFSLKIGEADFVNPAKSVRFWLEWFRPGTQEWLFSAGFAPGSFYVCGPGKTKLNGDPIVWPDGMPGFTIRGIDHAGAAIRPRADVPVLMDLGAQVEIL